MALAAMTATPAFADTVDYAYDELGRVIQAANSTSGQAIQYSYDPAGNITSVVTVAMNTISVAGLAPSGGAPGTQVTISGTGFSITPASNTVMFNGEAAVLVSATASRIVARVPSGATTGPVTVTVGAATGTSAGNFIVRNSDAPTIASYSPLHGPTNSTVTINGTNFSTTLYNNRVTLNQRPVEVISSTASTLTVKIPPSVASGRFHIVTPTGEATSPNIFGVLPEGYSGNTVAAAQTITVDANAVVQQDISGSDDTVLLYINGTVGMQDLRLVTWGQNRQGLIFTTEVYDPANKRIAQSSANPGRLQLPTFTRDGIYTVVIRSNAVNSTINATLTQPRIHGEFRRTWGNGSDSWTSVNGGLHELGILEFRAVAGELINMQIDFRDRVKLILRDPDGETPWTSSVITADTTLNLPVLQKTGEYQLLIDPELSQRSNIRYIAGVLPRSIGSTSVVSMGPGTPSSRVRIEFEGNAGESVVLRGNARNGSMSDGRLFYYNSGGSRTYVAQCCTAADFEFMVPELPATATYYFEAEGSSWTIVDVKRESASRGTLTPGSPMTITLPYLFQRPFNLFEISGSAGQAMSVAVNVGVGSSGSSCPSQQLQLIDPTNKVIKLLNMNQAATMTLGPLPASGMYRLATVNHGWSYPNLPFNVPAVYSYASGPIAGGGGSGGIPNISGLASPPTGTARTCTYTLTSP